MIVEPSRVAAHMLSMLFGRYGIKSRIAHGGKEALDMLESTPADLLCFAYELEDMDGIDLFVGARSRKLLHHQPGLMFSSTRRKAVLERALEAGVTECFSKQNLAQLEQFIEKFAAANRAHFEGRVLLVEDSMPAALFYRQVLERLGLQVEHCRSAEDAILCFTGGHYDLVLSDYLLAGIQTGFSVIQAVRDAPGKKNQTPILVISSFDDAARKVEILRNGANDFVGKPVMAEELEVRVANLLGMRKLVRRLEVQHDALRDLAMRDPLTTLYNRYYLTEESPGLIAEAHAEWRPLSLMIVDLDHFKSINDSRGHKRGDAVLEQTAKILRFACREEDIVARIGGEEFVAVMPDAGLADAANIAEAVRAKIAAHLASGIPVTASIGVAALAPGENFDDLFRRADDAMYRAKLAGRNRVELAAEASA